ncbi:hypothetical protein C2S53_004333 [Perilla frutescens var. hirtella]|uniref:C2 domain-containing protein n=1 Tax=Perilla frutescens var. hirtella TaxID=608512 RepID=A0AAD4JDF7_PERFH|nr:hypothetical protein C2S53_004333 [Perilla frutescens var. hirtella]
MEQYRTLEIKLQHAEDLASVILFRKMAVYAVVSISDEQNNSIHKAKSPVDGDGHTNPTWNFPMKFKVGEAALQMNCLTLRFKLVCQRMTYFGDVDVGDVEVPIKELLDSPTSAGADGWRCASHPVTKPGGIPDHKARLTFSYKFGEKTGSPAPPGSSSSNGTDWRPFTDAGVKIVEAFLKFVIDLDGQQNNQNA